MALPVEAPHCATTLLDKDPVNKGHGAPKCNTNERDMWTVEPETTAGVLECKEALDGVRSKGIVATTSLVVSENEESSPSDAEFGSAESAPPADVPN